MNRNTNLTIIKFSFIIQLLALVMFFIIGVEEPSFIAVCITMGFCTLVFAYGLHRLMRDTERPIERKRALIAMGAYLFVIAICVIIKVLVHLFE